MFVFITLGMGVCGVAQPLDERLGHLPAPTGPFGVGRVTMLCEDSSRIEPLDWNAAPRRVMVDVWYPAERSISKDHTAADYLNFPAFEHALGAERLKRQLGDAYDPIKTGRVTTHAIAGCPFASSVKLAPLLLFSPGGGMIRELYTAQMEELASHGYIVAAINHSYDAFLTIFPDGTSVARDGRRWPIVPSFEGEANLNQLEWHTDDMLAVLNHLSRGEAAPSSDWPFAGRVDVSRIGAFGHSFGGVAAAHAAQRDQRIKACLNQDGAMGMKPFYLDAQGWGMNQAFMLIERPPNREPLTDGELAAMKITRARATEFIARLNANRERALRSTGAGSYRVLLQRTMTTHMDFSDLQSLSAKDGIQLSQRLRVLQLVRSYTLAFFDRHVRGLQTPLLDRDPTDEFIESIERYAPAKRPL